MIDCFRGFCSETMSKGTRRNFVGGRMHFGTRIFVFTILWGIVVGIDDSRYHGNPDSMVFPGPISTGEERTDGGISSRSVTDDDSEISRSLQLAKELNEIQTAEEFMNLLQGVPENAKTFLLSSRFGEGEARSNAQQAIPAGCIPQPQPVSLKQDNDPSIIYFPPCTRVKRCGGCCSHSLLSCQPTATETRNFEVVVAVVTDRMGLSYKDKRIVPVEEHTKCKCDCRIKPEHCTEKQTYVQDECSCVCSNVDEAEKCRKNNETKLWDPDLCTCLCRNVQECNTGFYFDQNTCRCRQVTFSRAWFSPTKGADYRFGQTQKPDAPPVIVPLDAADPRRKPKEDPEYK